MNKYLQPTYYMNSDNSEIIDFTNTIIENSKSEIDKAIKLYYAVRDQIKYNPYLWTLYKESYQASYILSQRHGFCVQKAILLAAAGRAAQIPSRVGFGNVINHLSTKRMREVFKTDLFVFHGYTEFFLEGKWVKATPAFDINLCNKFNILPLEFNGMDDSIFHPFDKEGHKHMEYVHNYGAFDDFPFDIMVSEVQKYYPHLFNTVDHEIDGTSFDFINEPQ